MIEKITLRIFWTAMLLCASSALVLIWTESYIENENIFKIIPTFFIIGLANFLIWAPLVTYRFLNK